MESDCTAILFIPHQLYPNPLLIRKDMATTGVHTERVRERGESERKSLKNHCLVQEDGSTDALFPFSLKSL